MTEKTFVIRIFDGTYTSIYTTKDTNIFSAENKTVRRHIALGGEVVKVTTTEQRG